MRSSIDRSLDVGDPEESARAARIAEQRERRRLNGLKTIMSTTDGRFWMWSFLEQCGLFSTTFNGNSRDYFNLGQRNAGMPVFADLQVNFLDQYIEMVKENANV